MQPKDMWVMMHKKHWGDPAKVEGEGLLGW
jgi:hypothetical protein